MTLRRANRQIEVFDISLMAVVTKAMGAFLVIMLLLLPYYRGVPPGIGSPAVAQKAIDDARRQIAELAHNVGRFAEDPSALRRQLAAAQAALEQANASIRDLKTALDQTWSQLTRTRHDFDEERRRVAQLQEQLKQVSAQLSQTQRQLADAKDTVQLDARIIKTLTAKLDARPAAVSASTRPLVVLDIFTNSLCKDLALLPSAKFKLADSSHQAIEDTSVLPLSWTISKVLATSMSAPARTLLRMPGGQGIGYVTVTTSRAPPEGCQAYGQVAVIIADEAKPGEREVTQVQSGAFSNAVPNSGPILVAVVDRGEKTLAVRAPTEADVADWTRLVGGRVPEQPKPAVTIKSPLTQAPAGPGNSGGQANEQQRRMQQETQDHLLVRPKPARPQSEPPVDSVAEPQR